MTGGRYNDVKKVRKVRYILPCSDGDGMERIGWVNDIICLYE